ncbi:MAG: transcription antitermination factor NusB [Chlamydiales bacterium]|nr:transcription antitermination factor NusB [Chlamydiales bacterium]
MALSKQKFREIVFQLLFSRDFSEETEGETREMLMQQLEVPKSALREAEARLQQIVEHLPEIDRTIAALSKDYNFDRIPRVERSILRLGLFELMYEPEMPGTVSISEAIRLSRKFATAEASSFINAILDKAYQGKQATLASV